MVPSIGPLEIAVVLIVALLLLGPKRLPETARSIGRGMREFKASITGDDDRDDAPALKGERPSPSAPA